MATLRFEGGAARQAQVTLFAFAGTWEATDLIRVQIGNRIRDFTAGSTSAATVVSNLVTAWAALDEEDFPEFAEITPSANSTTLSLTAAAPGVPFTATLTPLEANGGAADDQTIEGAGTATTGTVATASAGPEDWSTAANWSTGAVPVNSDDVVLDLPTPIKYGLAQSGVTLASLTISPGFNAQAQLGLPQINEEATAYPESRPIYLAIGATVVTINSPCPLIRLNFGTIQTTCSINGTGTSSEDDVECVLLKGTHASNAFNIRGTSEIGLAVLGGETATAATFNMEDGDVRCGSGVTFGTGKVHGGTLELNGAVGTSLTTTDGDVTINGTGAVAQLSLRGGTCTYNTTGTLGGATVLSGNATLDYGQDPRTKTVTNAIELAGPACQVLDPNKVVSSLVIDFNESVNEGQVDWGLNVRLTRATPS